MSIDLILKYDLNIFAFIVLSILLLVIQLKSEIYNFRSRSFRLLVIFTMFLLVIEVLSWAFDGLSGSVNYFLNYSFNFIFTIFNTVVASFFATYIDFVIYNDVDKVRKRFYYLHPFIIVAILSIINIFYPVLFVVDTVTNVYSRLPLIWISLMMVYGLYVHVLVMVFRNRRRIPNKYIIGVAFFLLIPSIGSLFQLMYFGLLLIYPSTALAILFTYLMFETTSSSRDFNTGLFARSRVEDYINRLLERKKRFSVVMLDLDDFKKINDTFGHSAGDRTIVEFANALKTTFKTTDSMIARFGGDEFLVVIESTNKGALEYFKKDIYNILKNSEIEYVKTLKFSYGYSICTNPTNVTLDDLFIRSDNQMYMDKAKNKNLKRRKGDR